MHAPTGEIGAMPVDHRRLAAQTVAKEPLSKYAALDLGWRALSVVFALQLKQSTTRGETAWPTN
jgi:hypothetical protein